MSVLLEKFKVPNLNEFTIPEFIVHVQVTATMAKRQVNHWLGDEVSMMIGTSEPTLILSEKEDGRSVWRFPLVFTAPHVGIVGDVGEIEVDVQTGEMNTSLELKEKINQKTKELANDLPPFTPRSAPEEYIATNWTPNVPVPDGSISPLDIINRRERVKV
ncbi:MAG: hypothetical protein AAF639_02330 [Chloroflexota bacterium]